MKATKSKDGLMRFDLTIKARIDAMMAATVLAAADPFYAEDETPEAFVARTMKLGKRKLMNKLRDEIYNEGTETPWYRVGDNDKEPYRDALAAALRTAWGID